MRVVQDLEDYNEQDVGDGSAAPVPRRREQGEDETKADNTADAPVRRRRSSSSSSLSVKSSE